MHDSVRTWYAHHAARWPNGTHIVELGSLDVNGSIRSLYQPHAASYLGVDVVSGVGVDWVMRTDDVELPDLPPAALARLDKSDFQHTDLRRMVNDHSLDLVLCSEMLEHDVNPVRTWHEFARVLKPGGELLLTTRSKDFPRHHEPDRWRFTHDDIGALAYTAGLHVVDIIDDPQRDHPGVFVKALAGVAPPHPRHHPADTATTSA